MIGKIALLSLEILLIPFLVGILYNNFIKNDIGKWLSNWIYGFVICMGILQVLVLPCIFFDVALSKLTVLYSVIILVLAVLEIVVCYKHHKSIAEQVINRIKTTPWQAVFVVAIVVLQMYMYVEYQHTDQDDAFYVATAVAATDTDTVFQIDPYNGERYEKMPIRYVLSPFPIMIAILSRLSGIHPTMLSHTVLPSFYLVLTYGTYALIGKKLFKGNRGQTSLFVFFTALIPMYLRTTVYTQSSFMLLRIWQGKALLAAFLLPFVFYLGYRWMTDGWKKGEWIIALSTMLACCLATSMGIILGAISMGIMGILAAFYKKDIKLLIKPALCCAPNILLALAYLVMKG